MACNESEQFKIIETRVSRGTSANIEGAGDEIREYLIEAKTATTNPPLWPTTIFQLDVQFPVIFSNGLMGCYLPVDGAPYPAPQYEGDPSIGTMFVVRRDVKFARNSSRVLEVSVTFGRAIPLNSAAWGADLSLIGEQTRRDIHGEIIRVNDKVVAIERLRPQSMFSARRRMVRTDADFWGALEAAENTVNESEWTPGTTVPLTVGSGGDSDGCEGELTFGACTLHFHGARIARVDPCHAHVDYQFQRDRLGHKTILEVLGPDGSVESVKEICKYPPANWTNLGLGDMAPDPQQSCCPPPKPGEDDGGEEFGDIPPVRQLARSPGTALR